MVLSRDLQRRAQIAAGAVSSLEEVPMRAWVVDTPGPVDTGPLVRIHRPTPVPGRGQVLVRVTCCGVCRTDLHLAEGDLPPHRAGRFPVTRSSEWSSRRPGRTGSGRRPHRRAMVGPHRRQLPLLPARRREPLQRTTVHRVGSRRRVCGRVRRRRGVRLPTPRRRSMTNTLRLFSAPGSSATARCAAAASHPAAGSASTASAAAPTSPRRSPCTSGCGCTS